MLPTDSTAGLPTEPDGAQREYLAYAVLAYRDQFEESRPTAPASGPPVDAELIARLHDPITRLRRLHALLASE